MEIIVHTQNRRNTGLKKRKTRISMKTLAPLFFAGALVAGAAWQTFTGVITDSMCGKDHAMMKVTPDSKCVGMC